MSLEVGDVVSFAGKDRYLWDGQQIFTGDTGVVVGIGRNHARPIDMLISVRLWRIPDIPAVLPLTYWQKL